MKTILNIKTEKRLKERAQRVAKKMGLPLSVVVNSFLRQFIRDEEVTFSTKEYKMTPYLERLVDEARKDRKSSRYFKNAEKMIKNLNS